MTDDGDKIYLDAATLKELIYDFFSVLGQFDAGECGAQEVKAVYRKWLAKLMRHYDIDGADELEDDVEWLGTAKTTGDLGNN